LALDDTHDSKIVQMWSVILLTEPRTESPDFGDAGGAFATVFVVNPYEEKALEAARALVESHGWRVSALDTMEWIELEDFPPGAPGRELCEQAMVDGICARFHRWPVDAPDANETGIE
jgi:hypothetical protein